ncbi:hypothetical protein AVEN_42184-1 [Araneus ventricosus]|uniref:Uncharacterized protein n=1 Tax=Araneus ventricosus TaxID=182803 RepID=A0A4Y2B1H5_ARAVE|nr:hypothetical protein AVEN_42184-1 [Araneus ventricosus]
MKSYSSLNPTKTVVTLANIKKTPSPKQHMWKDKKQNLIYTPKRRRLERGGCTKGQVGYRPGSSREEIIRADTNAWKCENSSLPSPFPGEDGKKENNNQGA